VFCVLRTNKTFFIFLLARASAVLFGKEKTTSCLGLRTHTSPKKKQKKTRTGEEEEKKFYSSQTKSTRTKRNMFSSLSMRSALVGTSVPTTSTNSRGTRMHRSRRAKLARIPAKMHLFFSFGLSLFATTSFSLLSFGGVDFISVDVGDHEKGNRETSLKGNTERE